MAEALWANIGSKLAISLQRGPVDRKFQVEGVISHQPFFFLENYAKWSFARYKNLDRFFLPFSHNARVWQTDRQRDRWTEFSSLDGVCIPCSAVLKRGAVVCMYVCVWQNALKYLILRHVPSIIDLLMGFCKNENILQMNLFCFNTH